MFGSAILDLAVGLVFTFLAVSLAASAITETIASIAKWRSMTLKKGVQDLLNDRNLSGLGRAIYSHALVNPRGDGGISATSWRKLPAYIDPKNFAHAMMDAVGISGPAMTPAAIKLRIGNSVADPQLRELLEGIVDRTANTAADVENLLAKIRSPAIELQAHARDILT